VGQPDRDSRCEPCTISDIIPDLHLVSTLFYIKGVAPSAVKMQDIYKDIIPFVILQLIGILIVLMFPQLALRLPDIVFGR